MTDPTSDRDELAALMKDRLREVYMTATGRNYTAAFIMDDDPLNDVVVDGHVDFLDLASTILARWRLVPVEQDDAPIMEWHVHQWSDAEGHGMRCKECGDRVWIGIDPPARKMTMRRP